MNPVLHSTSSNLDTALIKLEAAQDAGELWEAIRIALHLALPLEFCCLNFSPFRATLPMLFRERAPFVSLNQFHRFCQLTPFSSYVQANPGVQYARLSNIISRKELVNSEYYSEFMRPTRSCYEACLIFWDGAFFEGIVGLHRSADHGDFSELDISHLLKLYPHLQTALQRVLRAHRERAVRSSLELLLDRLPLAVIILDWDLDITYQNRAAEELGVLWNLGPEAARSLKIRQNFAMPQEIIEACCNLKKVQNCQGPKAYTMPKDNSRTIYHEKLPGLRAKVDLLQMDAAPLSLPMFIVRLESRDGKLDKNDDDLAGSQLGLWVNLSRSEQRVAWLASQGHRNGEIARLLSKSTMTVKKQLQSVYRKLDVSGRSRLIALVSSGIDPNIGHRN